MTNIDGQWMHKDMSPSAAKRRISVTLKYWLCEFSKLRWGRAGAGCSPALWVGRPGTCLPLEVLLQCAHTARLPRERRGHVNKCLPLRLPFLLSIVYNKGGRRKQPKLPHPPVEDRIQIKIWGCTHAWDRAQPIRCRCEPLLAQ